MATETTTQTRPGPQEDQSFTNPYAVDFGKPDDQQKAYLAGLGPMQRKDRHDWLSKMHGEPMPVGPYPYYIRDYGWCQVDLPEDLINACYVKRGDLNLDVMFMTTTRHEKNGPTGKKTVVRDEKTKLQCKLTQESYDAKSGSIVTTSKTRVQLTGK